MFGWFKKQVKIINFREIQLRDRRVRVDDVGVVILEDRVSFCHNPEYEAYLCRDHSPYSRLDDIFERNSFGYRPSVYIKDSRDDAFADAYDERAILRGDDRRVWRCDMREKEA
jgi:hypothetical protein